MNRKKNESILGKSKFIKSKRKSKDIKMRVSTKKQNFCMKGLEIVIGVSFKKKIILLKIQMPLEISKVVELYKKCGVFL